MALVQVLSIYSRQIKSRTSDCSGLLRFLPSIREVVNSRFTHEARQ